MSRSPPACEDRSDRKTFHLHWVPFEPSLSLVTTCHVLRANKARATERNWGFGVEGEWSQAQILQPLREKDPACLEWPDLANKKKRQPVKFEFQTNDD